MEAIPLMKATRSNCQQRYCGNSRDSSDSLEWNECPAPEDRLPERHRVGSSIFFSSCLFLLFFCFIEAGGGGESDMQWLIFPRSLSPLPSIPLSVNHSLSTLNLARFLYILMVTTSPLSLFPLRIVPPLSPHYVTLSLPHLSPPPSPAICHFICLASFTHAIAIFQSSLPFYMPNLIWKLRLCLSMRKSIN